MLITEAIKQTQDQLKEAGQQERLSKARQLLAFVAGCEPSELILHEQEQLDEEQTHHWQRLSERLLEGEPLQYVLGTTGFMGLDFVVGPGVLIPRPDTEILVERAIELLKDSPEPRIADICTGSAAIGISLAHYLPQAQVYATDSSPQALAYAQRNAGLHQVEERCRFLPGDLGAPLHKLGLSFQLLVCNPPYITQAEMAELPPEVNQEPAMALYGGEDGLDIYRRLVQEAKVLLAPGGYLLIEHGWQQQSLLCALFTEGGWQVEERLSDYGHRARALLLQPLA